MAVVLRRLKVRVLLCCLLSRELLRGWRHFLGVRRRGFLFRSRLGFYTIRTVKAGMAAIHLLVHHVSINVRVVNDVGVHSRDGGVVTESVSFPAAAPVAIAPIAMAVVNAAVKTDGRTPVAVIKHVRAVVPAPPGRSPKDTDGWGSNPRARDQIIILVIAPVTGRPNVAFDGTRRLLHYRQNWGSDVDRYAHLRERGRERQYYEQNSS